MKIFLDLEFLEDGPTKPVHFLSIGLVAEDGREYYGVNAECPIHEANDWVRNNVLPHIDMSKAVSREQLRGEILAFVLAGDGKPEFWGWYSDYDWVVFCQLFGRMVDLPKGFPYFCRDLRQRMDDLGIERSQLPEQLGTEHNALEDARWNKLAWEYMAAHTLPVPCRTRTETGVCQPRCCCDWTQYVFRPSGDECIAAV